jgi:hypothetical protein
VRSNTESPCPRSAEVEILGVAFCGPCARQQEAYFAIGELTRGSAGPPRQGTRQSVGEDAAGACGQSGRHRSRDASWTLGRTRVHASRT